MTEEERQMTAVLAALKMPERRFEEEDLEEESEGDEEDFTEDEEGEYTDSEDEEWEQRKQARLRPGHCVLVHSLVRRPELNDCLGELVQFYADSGRWQVRGGRRAHQTVQRHPGEHGLPDLPRGCRHAGGRGNKT